MTKADLLKDFTSLQQEVVHVDHVRDGRTNSELNPSRKNMIILMMKLTTRTQLLSDPFNG